MRTPDVWGREMRRLWPYRLFAGAAILLVVALLLPDLANSQAAYQGFGTTTLGGSGGAVVRVTNLSDSGPGSLRDAVSRGNRTVVFGVAGEIVLSTYLYVRGANITIDGLTAPAPGITVKKYGLIIRGNRGAHDVIVRGIRVRDADIDGIQVAYGAYNVVIDHVSVTGSADGNIDITEGSHDVTVSWSIIGKNAKNMLVKYRTSQVSLHHNVFVGSVVRSPLVSLDDTLTAMAATTTADIRNNVVASWSSGGAGANIAHGPWANVVNNVYSRPGGKRPLTVTDARAYVSGNLSVGCVDVNGQGTETVPFPAPAVDTHDACTAASLVLAGAGVRPLDAVDQQLLSSIVPPACASLLPSVRPRVAVQTVGGGPTPPQQR
jgi:hypothetical protein